MESNEEQMNQSNSSEPPKPVYRDRFAGRKLKQSLRDLLNEICDDFENLEKYASSNCDNNSLHDSSITADRDSTITADRDHDSTITADRDHDSTVTADSRNSTSFDFSNVASGSTTEFNRTSESKNVIHDSSVSSVNEISSSLNANALESLPYRDYGLDSVNKVTDSSVKSKEKTSSNEKLLHEIWKDFDDIENCDSLSELKKVSVIELGKYNSNPESVEIIQDFEDNENVLVMQKSNLYQKLCVPKQVCDASNKEQESKTKIDSKELLAEILRDFESIGDNIPAMEKSTEGPTKRCDSLNVAVDDESSLNKEINIGTSKQDSISSGYSSGKKHDLPVKTCEFINVPEKDNFVSENALLSQNNLKSIQSGVDIQEVLSCNVDSEYKHVETTTNSLSSTEGNRNVKEVSFSNIESESILLETKTTDSQSNIVLAEENILKEGNSSVPDRVINFQQSSSVSNYFQPPENVIQDTVKSTLTSLQNKEFSYQKLDSVNELMSSRNDKDNKKQSLKDNDCCSRAQIYQPSISLGGKTEEKRKEVDEINASDKSPDTKARRITKKMRAEWIKELRDCGCLKCPMIGCFQTYVSVNNFEAHYKWCTGKNDLKQCPYCKSLIFASFNASLHHIQVEHPEKSKQYEASASDFEESNIQESNDFKRKSYLRDMPRRLIKSNYQCNRACDKNDSHLNEKTVSFNEADVGALKKCANLDNSRNKSSIESVQSATEGKSSRSKKITLKKKGISFSERHKRYIKSLKLTRDWASERKTYTRPPSVEDSFDGTDSVKESFENSYRSDKGEESQQSAFMTDNSLVANMLSVGFPDTITKLEKCIDRSVKINSSNNSANSNRDKSINLEASNLDFSKKYKLDKRTPIIANCVKNFEESTSTDLKACFPSTSHYLNEEEIMHTEIATIQNAEEIKLPKYLKSNLSNYPHLKNRQRNKLSKNQSKGKFLIKKNADSKHSDKVQNKFSRRNKANLRRFGIKRYKKDQNRALSSASVSCLDQRLSPNNSTLSSEEIVISETDAEALVHKKGRGRKRKAPTETDTNNRKDSVKNDVSESQNLRRSQRKLSKKIISKEIKECELNYLSQVGSSSEDNLIEKTRDIQDRWLTDGECFSEIKNTSEKKTSDECFSRVSSSSSGKKTRPLRASALKGKTMIQNPVRK